MTHSKPTPFPDLQASCQKCRLKSLCLPQGLVGFHIKMFDDVVSKLLPIKSKEYLYRQGDKFDNLYVVRSGCVKQSQIMEDGAEQVIGFSLPGELLGLDAIATGKYSESALTLDTTAVCKLEFAKFEYLYEKIPGLAKQVLKMAGQELIEEHDHRMAISTKNVEERLAIFLSSMSTRYKLLGFSAYELSLPMSRQDIGNYLGMAPETVSRTTTALIEQGLIEIQGRTVTIKDPDKLKKLAGHCEVCPSIKISHS